MVPAFRVLGVCAAALAVALPAGAAGSGGPPAYETRASAIASDLAGRPVSIVCPDGAQWRELARANGFEVADTWALTPFRWSSAAGAAVPADRALLSPRACRYGNLFAKRPALHGAQLCAYRATAAGRTIVPVWAECGDWEAKLLAVHVLTHESMHLAGEPAEAAADCLAVQLDAYVAVRMHASEPFARSLARQLWQGYVGPRSAGAVGCHDGGELDLFPGVPGWPTAALPLRDPAFATTAHAALAALVRSSPAG
jgi:hypothetical protein